MRLPRPIVLASTLMLLCACDSKSAADGKSEATKSETKTPDSDKSPEKPIEPAEPEQPAEPAEPEDGVTPVADGSAGLELELAAGPPTVNLKITPATGDAPWMASVSTKPEPMSLDELCSRGSEDDGVFATVTKVASTGYSKVLASKVVVLTVSNTFDDTGMEESGPAVLFWRDGEPVCWTQNNTDGKERMATGLFPS